MSRNLETTGGLVGALASKPEALLLLAAGAALLMRSGAQSTTPKPNTNGAGRSQRLQTAHAADSLDSHENDDAWDLSQGLSSVADQAKNAAGKARSYVSNVSDRAMESAGTYASSMSESVSDYADRARRSVVEGSGHVAETAQQTIQRVMREQPLSVALVGLAAGAAVAATFPATSVENSFFGPAKQKIADAVGDAGEKLKTAGQQAGEKLAEVVDEHGLNRTGLREAAADVAQAFGSGLRGGDVNTQSRSQTAETGHE